VRNGYSPCVHDEVGNEWFIGKCLWGSMSDDLEKEKQGGSAPGRHVRREAAAVADRQVG